MADDDKVCKCIPRRLFDSIAACLAEMMGTGMLVFFGCMGCVGVFGNTPLAVALTFGLTLMAIIQIFGHVSGAHVNPAVTVGALICKKISWKLGLFYILFQVLGAILGFGLLLCMTPSEFTQAHRSPGRSPGPNMGPIGVRSPSARRLMHRGGAPPDFPNLGPGGDLKEARREGSGQEEEEEEVWEDELALAREPGLWRDKRRGRPRSFNLNSKYHRRIIRAGQLLHRLPILEELKIPAAPSAKIAANPFALPDYEYSQNDDWAESAPRPRAKRAPGGGAPGMCVTHKSGAVHWIVAMLIEMLSTGTLVMVICSTFDSRVAGNSDSISLRIGLTVTAMALATGNFSGGSMNPARSLGPALLTWDWSDHWIYWAGPLLGAAAFAFLYRLVFLRTPEEHHVVES